MLLSPPTYTQTGWIKVGVLHNSPRQLDSITPTRESFVRDGFKVGFSNLYFPSTCMQTLPKQLSHCGPEGLCHKLLQFEDIARPKKVKKLRNTGSITGYYVNQTLPPSDLPSLNQKPNYIPVQRLFVLNDFDWTQPQAWQTSYLGCTQMRLVAFQAAPR